VDKRCGPPSFSFFLSLCIYNTLISLSFHSSLVDFSLFSVIYPPSTQSPSPPSKPTLSCSPSHPPCPHQQSPYSFISRRVRPLTFSVSRSKLQSDV
jgi:hypothetical protein